MVPRLGMGGDKIITQRAPVDPEHDQQIGVGPNGFGASGRFKDRPPLEVLFPGSDVEKVNWPFK
jgi:hypothetical protein